MHVQFGRNSAQAAHAFRHCAAAGLDRQSVLAAIVAQLKVRYAALHAGANRYQVSFGGIWIEYIAYKFADGAINVGRITPVNPATTAR